uniref:Uncharacterized protein n=1 Tax=Micrurus surinamensis TaxID=129470 RepID=A0A2D4NX65_MICSU
MYIFVCVCVCVCRLGPQPWEFNSLLTWQVEFFSCKSGKFRPSVEGGGLSKNNHHHFFARTAVLDHSANSTPFSLPCKEMRSVPPPLAIPTLHFRPRLFKTWCCVEHDHEGKNPVSLDHRGFQNENGKKNRPAVILKEKPQRERLTETSNHQEKCW